MPEYKNEIVEFKNNVPVHLTLATDPKSAKSTTRETQWGPRTSHTIFCEDSKVMFASDALLNDLVDFNKGDAVIITKVHENDRTHWTANPAGDKKAAPVRTESNPALQQIMVLLQEIKDLVSQKNAKENTKEYPKEDTDLEF